KAKLDKLQQIFPRGPARVVVYIDDLDRCPPNTVVEVLEAVQLLVKNPLFVAVLAIDERYINRALAQHYKGVLSLQGSPSASDYLEKIIQIPYRVRPIAEDALRSYLRAQTVVQDSETSGSKFNEFSPQEFNRLVNCCQEVELSPRSLKRLTNVYKLYKVLSRTRGQRPTPREQQAILTLLAFSSRYPDLMRDILQEIGSYYEEGQHKPDQDNPETLANIFNTACDKYNNLPQDSHLVQDAKKLRHDVTKLVADDLKLNEIYDIFTFVRSFSFVGDIGVDITASPSGDRI
ncbi:MAG: P-loop NTPase fold protein, partial [Microcystis aeruginosa]